MISILRGQATHKWTLGDNTSFSLIILSNTWQSAGISLHQGNKKNRKNLEQKFIFQISTLNPHDINERSSFNWSNVVFHVAMFLLIV